LPASAGLFSFDLANKNNNNSDAPAGRRCSPTPVRNRCHAFLIRSRQQKQKQQQQRRTGGTPMLPNTGWKPVPRFSHSISPTKAKTTTTATYRRDADAPQHRLETGATDRWKPVPQIALLEAVAHLKQWHT